MKFAFSDFNRTYFMTSTSLRLSLPIYSPSSGVVFIADNRKVSQISGNFSKHPISGAQSILRDREGQWNHRSRKAISRKKQYAYSRYFDGCIGLSVNVRRSTVFTHYRCEQNLSSVMKQKPAMIINSLDFVYQDLALG